MNNKIVTYILLCLVLVVWSYVFWKIFDFDKEIKISKTASNKSADSIISVAYEDSLVNDYPDPFFKRKPMLTTKKININNDESKKNINPSNAKIINHIPSIEFKYVGMIHNSGANKKLAVIKDAGQDYILKLQDDFKELKLVYISKDSIGLKDASKNIIYVKKTI